MSPIGMFDSGIGGLTVMQQVMTLLPHEQILYFGDTARLPYGEKCSETIARYAIENTIFLMDKNIKLLVVACNTASAHSMNKLKQLFNVPMVDVIESGVHQAVLTTRNQRIGVLGTRGTIQSEVYKNALLLVLPEATIISIACPLFTLLVEENFSSHPATKLIVKEYLAPLKNQEIDTLILGCTHFPLLASLIQEELPNTTIVDPAVSCASNVAKLLRSHNLESVDPLGGRNHQFFVSDDPHKFKNLATSFLGHTLPSVEKATSWSRGL
ncbi:MAG: glutamate racemase [Parachlamydiaceae bacterium]|nr:glutamate racemase [Parachlamydiaceae bacterium]